MPSRKGWLWLLGLGVVAVIVGVVVLVWPSQTSGGVGVLFGIYLLVSGVMQIMLAFAPACAARFYSTACSPARCRSCSD